MSSAFRRVLVPLDGSSLAARVLRPLGPLLDPAAEVTLLGVVEPPGAGDPRRGPALELELRAQRQELQERWGPGVEVRVEVAQGDPADRIVRWARDAGADLVAMSTHGRTGVERLVRGSVAEAVLRRCEAPLLLCPPGALDRPGAGERFERILVPLDGSPTADRILPLVEAVGRGHQAQVTLLRVEPLVVTEIPSPIAEGSIWDPIAVERSLDRQRDRLLAAGLRVDACATYGVVAAEIVRAAQPVDLLAMTTHGRSGLSRLWSGSVAEEVLRQVRCPVLVLRSGAT